MGALAAASLLLSSGDVRVSWVDAAGAELRGRLDVSWSVAFERAAPARACGSVGWRYQRRGALGPVLEANLRWLSGYRHARCHVPRVGNRLVEQLAVPMPLAEAVALVGDRLAVLPTLYHLLWRRVI